MRTISQLCRPSVLVAALVTSVLGACADSPTAPDALLSGPRSGLAIGEPVVDTTTPPPPVVDTTTPPPAPLPPATIPPASALIPVFVIGDAQPHGIGATVNFWGSHWSTNNRMSNAVSNGVASFKGYATQADLHCGGVWTSRAGAHPPAVIEGRIAVIVTTKVLKQGPAISGDIKQIVIVDQDRGYAPNAGHAGNGIVTGVTCTRP